MGRLVDVAATEEPETVRLAGTVGLVAALGGAVLMPVSSFWIQAMACWQIVRESRRTR